MRLCPALEDQAGDWSTKCNGRWNCLVALVKAAMSTKNMHIGHLFLALPRAEAYAPRDRQMPTLKVLLVKL